MVSVKYKTARVTWVTGNLLPVKNSNLKTYTFKVFNAKLINEHTEKPQVKAILICCEIHKNHKSISGLLDKEHVASPSFLFNCCNAYIL